ncbi:MAG: hypothetical protein ABIK83_00195 [Candidatus Zixiibacteriota bacterium]
MSRSLHFCALMTIAVLCSVLQAGELETQVQFLKSKYVMMPFLNYPNQDVDGFVHVAYLNPRSENKAGTIGYSRFDPAGYRAFPDVEYPERALINFVGAAPCRGRVSLLIFTPLHLETGYAAIDESGAIIDTGHFADQRSSGNSFLAPDGNAILV